ncbi:hypothetical protein BDW59DRAFT_99624 [Aspergillus cavernicola]|uniref:Uncharacterized protein n=1 Tax=Aspergillus cavernicola TaxID=176166 RepID=A0ABR4I5V2_9EURO
MDPSPSKSLLAACANPDSLFTTPQNDILRIIYRDFHQDIDRLQRAYSLRDNKNN